VKVRRERIGPSRLRPTRRARFYADARGISQIFTAPHCARFYAICRHRGGRGAAPAVQLREKPQFTSNIPPARPLAPTSVQFVRERDIAGGGGDLVAICATK
jgi:hypothetical protein